MLHHLHGTDELIVVGTGVLDDFGMLPWDLPAWLLRWTQYARDVGADVKFLAVGAGPIRNHLNRSLMLRAVRMAHMRTYRDTVSRDFLAGHGIDTAQDKIVPDIVFGISPEHLPTSSSSAGESTTVGVGVMGYYGWRNDPSFGESTYQEYVRKISQFVDWLIDQGYVVQLLIGERPADLRAVQDVMSAVGQLRGSAPAHLTAPTIESLDDLLGAIATCGTVVASRYHNVICALRLGKPVVALGYAEKFDALMRDVGLPSYCRNIEGFDTQELKALFLRMVDNKGELRDLIRHNTERYRREVSDVFDLTFGR
jgi:polysaccharide pyruvyl transferase WcaK-like protein